MLLKISQSLCLGFGLISSSALFAAVKEYHLVIDDDQSHAAHFFQGVLCSHGSSNRSGW